MKYIKEYNNYTDKEIKVGLKKAIQTGIIQTKKSVDEIVDLIEPFKPLKLGTYEYFIQDTSNFLSDGDMGRMSTYLDRIESEYNIDVSVARKHYKAYVRYYEIEKLLEDDYLDKQLSYEEINKYNMRQNYLAKDIDKLEKEINRIRKVVQQKRESE